MFCKRCGNLIPDDAKFCPKCGLENPFVDYKITPTDDTVKKAPPKPAPAPAPTPASAPALAPKADPKPAATKTTTKKSGGKGKVIAIIGIIAAVIGIIANFAGGSSLKGTWLSETGEYSITFSDSETGYFYENGVVMNSSERMMNFTYFTDGSDLTITIQETLFYNGGTMQYYYSISGDQLSLTDEDGYTEVFYKQ